MGAASRPEPVVHQHGLLFHSEASRYALSPDRFSSPQCFIHGCDRVANVAVNKPPPALIVLTETGGITGEAGDPETDVRTAAATWRLAAGLSDDM